MNSKKFFCITILQRSNIEFEEKKTIGITLDIIKGKNVKFAIFKNAPGHFDFKAVLKYNIITVRSKI